MFITFEGIDFCGKSTQVELLKKYLLNLGKQVEVIREPGGTEISEKIRTILLDKKNFGMTTETEIFLFSASRAQLVREKIIPLLNEGYYVISDRFHDSTTAYQGFGRGLPIESVKHINRVAIDGIEPDITFFIDITTEEAEQRKLSRERHALDRIEISNNEFFQKVREGYIQLSKHEKRYKVIDGTKNITDIHDFIIKEVKKLTTMEKI